MFDIRHRNAPCSIQELFQDVSEILSYNTRSSASNNFYKQSSKLSIRLYSFSRISNKSLKWDARKVEKSFKTLIQKAIKNFVILTLEDSHIDTQQIIRKVKLF